MRKYVAIKSLSEEDRKELTHPGAIVSYCENCCHETQQVIIGFATFNGVRCVELECLCSFTDKLPVIDDWEENQRYSSHYLSPKKQNPNRKNAKHKRQKGRYLDLELNL